MLKSWVVGMRGWIPGPTNRCSMRANSLPHWKTVKDSRWLVRRRSPIRQKWIDAAQLEESCTAFDQKWIWAVPPACAQGTSLLTRRYHLILDGSHLHLSSADLATVCRHYPNAALFCLSHRNGHEYLAQSLSHCSNDQTGSAGTISWIVIGIGMVACFIR